MWLHLVSEQSAGNERNGPLTLLFSFHLSGYNSVMDVLDLFSAAPGCLWRMQLFLLLHVCSERQQARANTHISKICTVSLLRGCHCCWVIYTEDIFVLSSCLSFLNTVIIKQVRRVLELCLVVINSRYIINYYNYFCNKKMHLWNKEVAKSAWYHSNFLRLSLIIIVPSQFWHSTTKVCVHVIELC